MRTRTVSVRSRAQMPRARATGPMAISRVVGVLEALSSGAAPLSLSALARMLAIPKTSLFNLMAELEQMDLVHRDGDGLYRQGGRSRRLGLQLVDPASFASGVRQSLGRIGAELGMTATFSRLDAASRALIYGDRWETGEPVRFALSLGQPLDLHCRSAGKLLVAHQPRRRWQHWLGPEPYREMTVATHTTFRALKGELATIAETNIAWSRGESFPGVGSCNVGLAGADGKVLAALGVELPMARLRQPETEEHIVQVLRQEASWLAQQLAARAITQDSLPLHI